MQLGFIDLPWWGYALVTLGLTHVTIASVTIFLHRHQAHRALALHPVAGHFFRFWLWFSTGMVTREWVAIHRKHHARCETADDPHSPQIHGIRKVLFQGAELYRSESVNAATIERFGSGTPDDWIEQNLYSSRTWHGVGLMMVMDLALFGPIGLTMWAVQMLWIPFFAAGVVNGVGHYWGYRNFAPSDASRNIVPWGILIGGEELHNNHHAYVTSARLSNKWWEFDIGWFYIRILQALGLATVRRVAPKLRVLVSKTHCDADTLQAVITHRCHVLARFAESLKRTASAEVGKLQVSITMTGTNHAGVQVAAEHWLQWEGTALTHNEQAVLEQALRSSKVLRTIDAMRQDLADLWCRSTASKEQLVKQLEDWCRRAEESGIRALQEFSRELRCYTTDKQQAAPV
jgi:stearoyl-CoA desaturase (Delta-9 desaturase)